MTRALLLITPLALGLLSACSQPNTKALHTLACQQAANTLDLQSVAQLDLLRKALGVAPGVDPIGTCRALGVNMTPEAAPAKPSGAPNNSAESTDQGQPES